MYNMMIWLGIVLFGLGFISNGYKTFTADKTEYRVAYFIDALVNGAFVWFFVSLI